MADDAPDNQFTMSADDPSCIKDHYKVRHPQTYDLPQFFGIVENQVYRSQLPQNTPAPSPAGGNPSWLTNTRSEYLQPMHYPYIQTLELTTILVLSPEKPSRALKSFAEENSIKLVKYPPPSWRGLMGEVHLGLQGWKPDHAWSAMAEGLIQDSLRIVLSPKTHPILVTSTYLRPLHPPGPQYSIRKIFVSYFRG